MSEEERSEQQQIHDALEPLIAGGNLLTGWVIVFEAMAPGEPAYAGHLYGPGGMTTWRALGLVEWARANTLRPDDDDD